MMERYDFVRAIKHAHKGQRIPYHTGLLMRDRVDNKDVDKLANIAYDAYLKGVCTLTQRRIKVPPGWPSSCEYYAVKL